MSDPKETAKQMAFEHDALAFAYRVVGQLHADQGAVAQRAAEITVEALQDWERKYVGCE